MGLREWNEELGWGWGLVQHQAGIPEDEAVVDFDSLAATRGGKDASSTPHLAGMPPPAGRALLSTASFQC